VEKEEIYDVPNGEKVLVMGGSSGIGLGVAEALLQEGATVTIVGRGGKAPTRTLAKSAKVDLETLDLAGAELNGQRYEEPSSNPEGDFDETDQGGYFYERSHNANECLA
jgi:NAD(P)-dependent dehydrogenase (short-subunit alcohol dehydrogenase family)